MNIERKDTPTATPLMARPPLRSYRPRPAGAILGAVQVLVGGEAYELDVGEVCVLGRDESCDVVVADVLVSRRHLLIRVLATGVMLEDLRSRNGVYVNGSRLTGTEIAHAGDHVLVGSTEVSIFSSGSAKDAEPRVRAPLLRMRKR